MGVPQAEQYSTSTSRPRQQCRPCVALHVKRYMLGVLWHVSMRRHACLENPYQTGLCFTE